MGDDRPDPDDLLARVEAEEAKARRGRLKIFFGYAAGVGKTYAMLEAARRDQAAGVDVVAGYVEPHGRAETESLLEGIERIPDRKIEYRGVILREFDLDATLARKPTLALVDELAHTNAEGCRHVKRWQDVVELLDAGIDVYTTLNVQHLESLNDVIASITGITVSERLPDAILDRADDIELVDITPEELLRRLEQGKVYVPEQAQRALRHFFKTPNLAALRELSLRHTARRLQRDVDAARQDARSLAAWPTTERLLVCVGPSPTGAKLVRAAKRVADALNAEWLAVSVNLGGEADMRSAAAHGVASNLRLAETLGAETHVLVGANVADTVLGYARSRNISRVLVGKTAEPAWKRLLKGSVVDQLIGASGDIDVILVQGEGEQAESSSAPRQIRASSFSLGGTIQAVTAVAAAALIGWPMRNIGLAEANIIMIFLAAVAVVSSRCGRGPSVLSSVLGVVVFDLLFVPPYYSFAVSDSQYVITLAVMLAIGLLISGIATLLRRQIAASQKREWLTHALYRLSKQLGEASGVEFILAMAGQRLTELFDAEVVVYLRASSGSLEVRFGQSGAIAKDDSSRAVAEWVAQSGRAAGLGTDTLASASALFLPLSGSQHNVGVVGVKPRRAEILDESDQRRLLDTCVGQIALAIERDQMSLEAYEARLEAESERLRSSLLSSVSHDLRTPLAVIAGASASVETLARERLSEQERTLIRSVVEESDRLARLVDNLLDMTRLESPALRLRMEPQIVEELVGSALARAERMLAGRAVEVSIPEEMIFVEADGLLVEQLLVNLLDNADKHTPPGTPISVSVKTAGTRVEITVADRGPGLEPGAEQKVFEKFFRGDVRSPDARRGVGLGLAICKAIAEAHGGSIKARNREGGGAAFVVSFPTRRITGASAPPAGAVATP